MSYLIYDGECPVCSRYAEFVKLKRSLPDLQLLDARENRDHEAVQTVIAAGYVLDEGMAFVDGHKIIYGDDVMRKLEHHAMARHYSLLKKGRSLLLRLLGRRKMGY